MSPLEFLRAGYGAGELLAPDAVEGRLLGHAADHRSKVVIRILGARHLVQAALTSGRGPAAHRVGGTVDLIHAVTMLALAAADRRRRRAATVNAVLALVFSAAEFTLGSTLSHRRSQ
ncbi:hypothetical protein KIH31_14415 [Paenarthrobacter sp. DKR-5]|uniref:hypothetical protein n=1 Tax=Paenarthrobacter sp. DKR-5 TaxID=2835535 RepID=UPI001BDCF0D6|nr:hypothetical protein [Paenarthrobacter sp. DKR-5]MBT1003795.1 hypothetical protein [Paenarthrobacter sp. DKR-5]